MRSVIDGCFAQENLRICPAIVSSVNHPSRRAEYCCAPADVVITMGCGDACPIFPGKRYENWELPDPAGRGVDVVRPIRDDIAERIHRLLADLNVPETR